MFVSHHTLKWTRTCRSHGRHPHAHTAHFLLNRHILEPSGKVAHQDTRHRFPCPYRAVLNFPGTLAFSGVFIYAAKLFVTELGTGIFTLLPSGNVSRGSVSQRSSIQAFDIAFPHTCNEFFKGDIPVFRLRNRDGIYVKRLNTTPCLSYSIEYSVSHFIWNAIRISA